jgi:hypothetical protein
MKRIYFLLIALVLCAGSSFAQPRPVDSSTKTPSTAPGQSAAPASFEAKYEGGMFGYNSKEAGVLKFDDDNERLVFFGKDQKEKFHIPYKSVLVIYPQSKKVTSTAGTVVSHIPLPGAFLGGLIKEKRRYLVLHFDDPDVEAARGLVNFKLDNKALLDSVIQRLAGKAELKQRGDAYYRAKQIKNEI